MHLRLRKLEKLPQTCGFAVTEHLLQFCGNESKFAVPSTAYLTVGYSIVKIVSF